MEKHESYIEGAKKLLLESLKVDLKNKVVLSSTARKLEISKYFMKQQRELKEQIFAVLLSQMSFVQWRMYQVCL